MDYYTLTFVPGCNKNADYIFLLSEGDLKDEIVEYLCHMTGTSSKNLDAYILCNPFECEFTDIDKCYGICMKDKDHITYHFNEFNVRDMRKLPKDFVEECCESLDHFRIDKWESKSYFSTKKKSFLKDLKFSYV